MLKIDEKFLKHILNPELTPRTTENGKIEIVVIGYRFHNPALASESGTIEIRNVVKGSAGTFIADLYFNGFKKTNTCFVSEISSLSEVLETMKTIVAIKNNPNSFVSKLKNYTIIDGLTNENVEIRIIEKTGKRLITFFPAKNNFNKLSK